MKKRDWKFSGLVERVIDGDTIVILVDLGFDISHRVTVRLAGIECPEVRGDSKADGLAAKVELESLILGEVVWLRTEKKGKYGRYIGLIEYGGIDINKHMSESGLCARRE